MTPLEMHIEIDQALQKLASNVYDNIKPEEKDWVLNKVQERYIKAHVKPDKDKTGRFEIDQKSTDDLQELIETNINLLVYQDTNSIVNKWNRAYTLLPDNYMYLLSDRSKVVNDCNVNFTNNVIDKIEYVGVLKFNDSTKGSSKYYTTLTVTINGVIKFNIADYPISSGLSAINEKFVLKTLIIEKLQSLGYNIVWESYRDIYEVDSFIIISDTTFTASINVDTIVTNATVANTTYKVFSTQEGIERKNRMTRSDILYDVLPSSYHRTIPRSPVTNLSKDQIYVFYNERFIVNRIMVDYIRKPRTISLILNQSCELVPSAHQEICDLSVEYIKQMIESPSYQLKLQDNMLRMQ